MSKKEVILQELDAVPEEEFDAVLRFIHSLKSKDADAAAPALLAESLLMKDWLSPDEEAAWAICKRGRGSSALSVFRSLPNEAASGSGSSGLERGDLLLSQITSQAKSDPYSAALNQADFEVGGLNRQSYIRRNRLFTADCRVVLYSAGRIRQNKLREAVNGVISILNA